jgi:hypothetical protein
MAVGLPFIAAEGVKNRKRVERQRRRMRELVERHGDPYLRSFADSACGAAAWLHGEWSEARRLCLSATEGLLNCSPPPLYEVANTWLLSAEAASWSGDFAFIGAEIHGWLARARAWGDRHLQCTLTARFVAMGHLVAGSPDRAERAVERAVREWPATGVATLTLWAAVSRATAALYRGEPRRALDGLLTERPRLRNAGLLQVELYRLMFCDLIGRSASAVAQSARGVERARLLVMVERQAGELLSSGAPWAKGLGEVLRAASLWHLTCDAAARRQLRVAARSFRARGMRVHALSALRQEATSRGAAPTDVAALDAELAALGIAEPERVAALTVPVFV